jgi:hypothetical protein
MLVRTSEIIRSVGPRLTSPSKGGVEENIERMDELCKERKNETTKK